MIGTTTLGQITCYALATLHPEWLQAVMQEHINEDNESRAIMAQSFKQANKLVKSFPIEGASS